VSAFAVKILATAAMLIDHTAAALGGELPMPLYTLCRTVGRIAMPLFCFLIAEGLFHTKNARRYLLRLLLFSLVSEAPFDLFRTSFSRTPDELVFFGGFVNLTYQNVGFTLTLGLLGILLFDVFAAQGRRGFALASILAAGAGAALLRADYGFFGVFFIFVFYFFRNQNRQTAFALAVGVLMLAASQMLGGVLWREAATTLAAFAAFIPVWLYSGEKGRGGLRTLFYVFYPAHLLILAGVATLVRP
jgi:hypothetical protein